MSTTPDYCGWVPTVGGRLSFSIIGNSQITDNAFTVNIADDKKRYMICHQQRILLDSAIPVLKEQLNSLLFSYDGTFEFLLIAEGTNDPIESDAGLEGYLCFFPTEGDGWKENQIEIQQHLSSFTAQADTVASNLSDLFNHYKNTLVPIIESNSYFYATFKLSREGIVGISLPTQNSLELNKFSDDLYANEPSQQMASAQLFFFLKDISHVHQHHYAKTDTIIDLHPYDKKQSWRHRTIRALYRKVLRFKRTSTEDSCLASLGVLSYLRTFKRILNDVVDESGELPKIAHLSLEDKEIEKSIKIALDKARVKSSRKSLFWNNLRTVTIGIFGILLALIGLARFVDPVPTIVGTNSYIPVIVNFAVTSPVKLCGIIIMFGILLLFMTGDIPWRDWTLANDSERLLNVLPKWLSVFLAFGIATGIMWLAIIILE